MVKSLDDRRSELLPKILQQRATVEALKRDGHEYTDAERQLRQMLDELKSFESSRPTDRRRTHLGSR